MTLKIQEHIKKISLVLIILMIFLSIGIPAEEEGNEGGRCEQAYLNCMNDAVRFIFILPLFFNFVIYCTTGYIFCKKFLEA
jgi:hypothetical protein